MNLISLSVDTIPLGQPLPFALRGLNGVLLAQKGYVIRDRSDLDSLILRGVELCVDTNESGDSHRAYLSQLQRMLLSQESLGSISRVQIDAPVPPPPPPLTEHGVDWMKLQLQASQLLRSPYPSDFLPRFHVLFDTLRGLWETQPDASLLALILRSGKEMRLYSATHSMLVAMVCMEVARKGLNWSEEHTLCVGRAALSMNCAMTALQDQLALQTQALSADQMAVIEHHPEQGARDLQTLGVTDPLWLEAVRLHHHRNPGRWLERSRGEQMARLIQRADVFAARLAPRATRTPMPVTAAMQACYHDEARQVDTAGAAIVKTLGVYPPGAYVRLASNEVAVVLRRGNTGTTPRVAVLLNREGLAVSEPIPRDTSLPSWKITTSVPHHQVRVEMPLERLMDLL